MTKENQYLRLEVVSLPNNCEIIKKSSDQVLKEYLTY